MNFKKEYAKSSDKAEDKAGKTVISDEAFAIGELLEQIKHQLLRG